jgi:uncharacterized protein with HEPN domain
MSQRAEQRIDDMLRAARKAVSFTRGRTREDLDTDEMLALALVRLLEIIGEAARHVPEERREAYDDVPWRQIMATRNRLIHGYFSVDLDIVWSIVQKDLPPLIAQLEAMQQRR